MNVIYKIVLNVLILCAGVLAIKGQNVQVKEKATAGIGEVTAVEAKAKSINEIKTAIEKARSELVELESKLTEKINNLRIELDELYKERDSKLRDLKAGFFCSQCKKMKTDLEKSGESFEEHLRKVNGVPVPASTSEIEALRENYKLKIAYKKVQIQNLEKGDASVINKRNEIAELEKKLVTVCEDITTHSKKYEKSVVAEAKEMQNFWIRELMDLASNTLIPKDKIVIYNARIITDEKEFEKKSAEIKEEVKKQNEAEQNKRRLKMEENRLLLERITIDSDSFIDASNSKSAELNTEIARLDSELRKPGISEETKKQLTEERTRLSEQVTTIGRELAKHKSDYEARMLSIKNENTALQIQIGQLFTGLSRQQEEVVLPLRVSRDKKKAETEKLIEEAMAESVRAKSVYAEKVALFDKKNSGYAGIVSSESGRMVVAAKEVSCPVWNNTSGLIAGNWNSLLPCVNTIVDMAKPGSTHIFGSYCPNTASASYLSVYKTFLRSLSDEDKQLIKANSNANWFDELLK